ncbi:MAG TPA: thioesterase [Rhizobiales bacterium]|nr:thioesterase [Hyphomicrobiales bacterium]
MPESGGREALVTYRGSVYPWHCDQIGHMNVMWYVGKFDEATWQLFATAGITPGYVRKEMRGMAAVEQNITYRRELLAGDVLHITSRMLEAGEKFIKFRHEMFNSETGELCATCELTGLHLDRKARKAVAFPEAIAARLKELTAAPPE